jgi:uncharacterized protein YggE
MTDEPIVAVRGEVFREVDPELAELGITVAARDKDRQTTLTRLTERVAALRSLLDRYAGAIERRETGGVFVRPETKRSGERVAGYTGTVSTIVTVKDFTVLGELLIAVADQDLTSVYGPSWSLRPDSPVYAEARRAAIGEAFARGREYAEAVGARVVRLLELTDTGLGSGGAPPVRPMAFAAQTRSAGAYEGAPAFDLEPQRQQVHASVEARFAISEPAL